MLLVWAINAEDNIPVRHIDDSFRNLNEFRYLVIDGQQRLTSLLLVKQGYLFKKDKRREIRLLFNVLTEEFQIENPKIKNKPEWLNVTEIINTENIMSLIRKKDLQNKLKLTQEQIEEQIFARLNKIKNIFTGEGYTIPIFKISRDVDYNEVTDIFVKLNEKGTKIRITELLLALLSLKLPGKFKENLNKFLTNLEGKGWVIDTSVIIRCLVAIAVKGARLRYFRKIVDSITEESLQDIWKMTQEAVLHCLQILEQNIGIRSSRILPSQIVLVPLVFYLSTKERLSEKDTREFILWFLLSSYWGRYTGPVETRLEEDIKYLDQNKNFQGLLKYLKNQVGRLFVSKDDFVGAKQNAKLLSYVALRNKKAEDWFKGHLITTSDYEEHHIFPRSLLFDEGYNYQEIDDVANIAFLTQKANRSILNKEPFNYLSGVDKRKLAKQCVVYEKNILKIRNYKTFLKRRRSLLVKEINNYLISLGLRK
jgi:hypothetical protein